MLAELKGKFIFVAQLALLYEWNVRKW